MIQCLAAETKSGESVVRYIALQEDKVVTGPDAASLDVEPAFHLAIEGPSFEVVCDNMRDSVLPFLATRGAVFARMRPDMKQRLVEILQDLDFVVIMCGDGANDCGALKAANAGISLSEAVRMLSPVTITVLILAPWSSLNTAELTGFNLFSRTTRPRKVRLSSACSLVSLESLECLAMEGGRALPASAIMR